MRYLGKFPYTGYPGHRHAVKRDHSCITRMSGLVCVELIYGKSPEWIRIRQPKACLLSILSRLKS